MILIIEIQSRPSWCHKDRAPRSLCSGSTHGTGISLPPVRAKGRPSLAQVTGVLASEAAWGTYPPVTSALNLSKRRRFCCATGCENAEFGGRIVFVEMSAQQPSLGPEINNQGQNCAADLAKDGLLTFLGYHVGTSGKSERARQEILRRAFSFIALTVILHACVSYGQDSIKNVLTMGFGDLVTIREKAEAGDPAAQNALGEALEHKFRSSEAVVYYRKAVTAGNVEAAFNLGRVLLYGVYGGGGLSAANKVAANPAEGIRWMHVAATNSHRQALFNLSRAFQCGLGTSTNLVEAYAWMQLYAESGSTVGRVYLNEMALKLDSDSIRHGQALAERYKRKEWSPLVARTIPEGDARLRLNGVTLGRVPLAVINGKTLGVGDSAALPLKPSPLRVTCLEIKKESVLVAIEGEDAPRQLALR